jgi:hypothetical protein
MATVYPFPMAFYHPFMLWRKFILSLWLFIYLSCYGDSLSFPYGSLSSFHVMVAVYPSQGCLSTFHVKATVYPFPMDLNHPFMLWRLFILSLCIFSSIHVMAIVYPFPMALYHPFMLWLQFLLSLWLFIYLSCYGDSWLFPLSSIHVIASRDSLSFPYGPFIISYVSSSFFYLFSSFPYVFSTSLCIYHSIMSLYLSFISFIILHVFYNSLLSFLYCMHPITHLCTLSFRYVFSSFPNFYFWVHYVFIIHSLYLFIIPLLHLSFLMLFIILLCLLIVSLSLFIIPVCLLKSLPSQRLFILFFLLLKLFV